MTKLSSHKPLVSVIIPAYNAWRYLRPSVESILNQSYSNLEVLLVDDGSTDNSIDTLSDIKDPRLQIIQQKNSGKSSALNHALELISGEFFAIQDADDLSYPTRIEYLVEGMHNNSDLGMIFSGYDLIINSKRI